MKKFILLIISIVLFTPSLCRSQGTITRPSQSQQKSANAKSIISRPDDYVNGHGYVDLALPSGTKWANLNLGASKPSETGYYFFWGDSENIKFGTSIKELIDWKIIDDKGNLMPDKDQVTTVWGQEWQTPSREDCEELIKFCKWEMKKINGIRGYLVTGKNNKSIFLPFSGWKGDSDSNTQVYDKNDEGYYLTHTYNMKGTVQDGLDTFYALCISCWQGQNPIVGLLQRPNKRISIRPVLKQ